MAISALRPRIRVCALSQDQLQRRARTQGRGFQATPAGPRAQVSSPCRLTQETTRPLKQGSLALSSEISSFTTLWADSREAATLGAAPSVASRRWSKAPSWPGACATWGVQPQAQRSVPVDALVQHIPFLGNSSILPRTQGAQTLDPPAADHSLGLRGTTHPAWCLRPWSVDLEGGARPTGPEQHPVRNAEGRGTKGPLDPGRPGCPAHGPTSTHTQRHAHRRPGTQKQMPLTAPAQCKTWKSRLRASWAHKKAQVLEVSEPHQPLPSS